MARSVLLLLSVLLLSTTPEHVEEETGVDEAVRVQGLVIDRDTNEMLAGPRMEVKSVENM